MANIVNDNCLLAMTGFNYDLLEHPYSIQILLNLKDHFPMKLMDLQKEIKANRSTLERRIDELARAGMIKIELMRNMKRKVRISLTPSAAMWPADWWRSSASANGMF